LAICALVVLSSICERMALLSRRYALKDLPLTVDEDSNRTELYYIIFSLVILIRLEIATTITRIPDSPRALRFISMSNVQITTWWVLGRLGWVYVTAKKIRHIGSYREINYSTTYNNYDKNIGFVPNYISLIYLLSLRIMRLSEHTRLIPDTKWIMASPSFAFNTGRLQTTLVASSLLVGRWCRRVRMVMN
jgi:hypothetical protein